MQMRSWRLLPLLALLLPTPTPPPLQLRHRLQPAQRPEPRLVRCWVGGHARQSGVPRLLGAHQLAMAAQHVARLRLASSLALVVQMVLTRRLSSRWCLSCQRAVGRVPTSSSAIGFDAFGSTGPLDRHCRRSATWSDLLHHMSHPFTVR